MKKSRIFAGFGGVGLIAAACFVIAQGEPSIQSRGVAALHVPRGFRVEQVTTPDLVSYPMMGTLDERGRLFLCESSGNTLNDDQMKTHPDYKIRVLEDRDGDGVFDHRSVFADGLTLPAGAVWHRNSLYVASPPDLLRFDGETGGKKTLVTGWHMSSNAASLHGPFFGPDGFLYLTDARHAFDIKTKDGREFSGKSSRIWRLRPDGTGLEWFAGGGFDNPVELVFTPAGETIGTMTYYKDPENGERDALLHFVEGGVYPKWYSVVSEFKRTGDLMPVMTKFARIAPAGLARYRGSAFGPEYKGNLFSAQFNPHRVQRHIVRDRAVELLVEARDDAVDALVSVRRDPEARAAAVFALYRIGTPKSAQAVRAALTDADFRVRTAAARCAGMSGDREAVARLMQMGKKDHPAARRQAAAALGQSGDLRATAALLSPAAHPPAPFVPHSIIYSLIPLNPPQPS